MANSIKFTNVQSREGLQRLIYTHIQKLTVTPFRKVGKGDASFPYLVIPLHTCAIPVEIRRASTSAAGSGVAKHGQAKAGINFCPNLGKGPWKVLFTPPVAHVNTCKCTWVLDHVSFI